MTIEQKKQIDKLLKNTTEFEYKTTIAEEISQKTILITGAVGSIGSEIVRQILKHNPKIVLLLDIAEVALNDLFIALNNLVKDVKVIPILADIKDVNLIFQIFKIYKPAIVYHTAANKYVPFLEDFPYQAIQNNVLGTKIVSDCAKLFGVEKFVFVSTDKAVNPKSVMGASKRMGELYVQALSNETTTTHFIITRFGNVFGSSGSVAQLFYNQIKNGGPITITHPDMERYFMTISQACELVIDSSIIGKNGEVFFFEMGSPIKIVDLANQMIISNGFAPGKDIRIEWIGIRPGEKLQEELLSDGEFMQPTKHLQIKKVAQLKSINHIQNKKNIEKILNLLFDIKEDEIKSEIGKIVPEYQYI